MCNTKILINGTVIAGTMDTEIQLIHNQQTPKITFGKSFEGTLSNVEISEEFEDFIEKQRKLAKIKNARERLNKYVEK